MKDELDKIEEQDDNWDDGWDDDHSDWKSSWNWSGSNNWTWGFTLVLLGILFLLDNLGITNFQAFNWWAIFILAPGLNMLARAYSRYQDAGRITRGARRSGLWGIFLVALALSFLFNLSWAMLGPAFLILAGLYLLFIR
jgi:hypothetical protein